MPITFERWPLPAETMAELRGGPVSLRIDEDEDAERLCFGPKRVERRVRDFLAGDVADAKRPKGSIWRVDLEITLPTLTSL